MTVKAHIDFETRSACDLRKSGVYRYAEDPTTNPWGFAWSMGDGLVYQWRPGFRDPDVLLRHIANGGMTAAHNAGFERRIWQMMREKGIVHGWPELPIRQQDCTMARAAALGLPQDLDSLSTVLGFTHKKDMAGHNLMMKLSRPRKRYQDGSYEWWDDPLMVHKLMDYCEQDVRVEIEADQKLLPLSAHERKIWELDQLINDRGVYVNETAITRAVDVVLLAKQRADVKMRQITGGSVKKCSEVGKLVEWINMQGVITESAKKGNHEEIIAMSELIDKPQIRRAIELRKEASKTSTAKYSKMLDCICQDGHIRGLLNYHGAGPGRWAGRLVQPQNFPRVDPDYDGPMVEYTSDLLDAEFSSEDIHDMIELGGFEVMPALSKTLRAMICAV